jgi:hypothetical protein
MQQHVEAIRAAIEPDAAPDVRNKGVEACRAILAALDATPSEPMAAVVPASQIASIVGALRGLPPDQLLDLAISKLRAALPSSTEVAPVAALKLHIVPVPRRG